jgi:long-chain fatty acid transport protein
MKACHKIIGFAVLAALGAGSQQALASGFQLVEQNASGLGNAYSGQAAAAENASTIFFNPAGMTYLPGKQFSGSVSAIKPSAEFNNDGNSVAPPLNPLGTNGGDAGGWNYLPAAYFSWQLTQRFWAGIGIAAPFGLKTDYDPTFIGRFQSQKVDLKTYDINPSIAFKFNDVFSLGGGFSYQKSRLSLDRSFSLVLSAAPETVSLNDSSWGWNLGGMLNLGPGTRLGLTYRSAVNYDLTGGVTVAGVGNASAKASVSFPDTAAVAISHQFNDKWQVLGDVTWTHWSKIQNIPLVLTSALGAFPAGTVADTLDFQFKNTYRVGVGVNCRWTDRFMLKFGGAFDTTPVPDFMHRTTFLPDNNRAWLAIGAKFQFDKNSTLDYGYAHLFVNDGGTFRNKGTAVAPGQQGIVSGVYKDKVDIISIQYTYAF